MMRNAGQRTIYYFGASFVGIALSLATLPFATRILGPEDYGTYAIVVTISILIQGMAAALHAYLLPAHLANTTGTDRQDLILTILTNTFASTAILSTLAIAVTEIAIAVVPALAGSSSLGILLTVASTAAMAPWLVAIDLFALEGRAGEFAAITILQNSVTAAVLLVGLFILQFGAISLYLAFFAGNASAGIAAFVCMRHDIRGRYRLRWVQETRRFARLALIQRLAESGMVFLERSVIGGLASVREVGLYTHAQLYGSGAIAMLTVISRGMLPINLEEARANSPLFFPRTRQVWVPVQLFLVLVITGFALVGQEFISVLTNGKFAEAHLMAYLLLVAATLLSSGKPETAFLMATGRGNTLARLGTVGTLMGAAALIVLVPFMGATGAALAMVARVMTIRIGLYVAGRRFNLPFQDKPLLVGLATSALVAAVVFKFEPDLLWRLIVSAILGIAALVLLIRILKILSTDISEDLASQPSSQTRPGV
jgi:O-antigen/teichoic acid export membrane protein